MSVTPLSPTHRLTVARVFAIAALCMTPVSTALTNITCALFALALLTAPEFWRRLPGLPGQRAALTAVLLLATLAASVAWTVAPHGEAWSWVGKYSKLLLLPLAVLAFEDSDWAPIVRWSLFATLTLIVVMSTTNGLGLTALGPAHGTDLPLSKAWVFKNHIAAGMFDALLFYQAADLALSARSGRSRALFIGIAALTLVNVAVMLHGRTGQIITFLFLVVVALRAARQHAANAPRRAPWFIIGAIAIAAVLLGLMAKTHGDRLFAVVQEVQQYRQHDAATSSGLRLEWYQRSLELVAKRPVFGYGAGGLGAEFAKISEGKSGADGLATLNPHNEYLLMAVQLGAIGVALFVYMLFEIWRGARRLEPRSKHLLLGWLATFAIGALVNSLLLDFAEGHMLTLLAGCLLGCGFRGTAAPHAPRRAA